MVKEYTNSTTTGRVEWTTNDFQEFQNYYLKKIIRHTHPVVEAGFVKISESGEKSAPVGLPTPLEDGKVWTWQDHEKIPHGISLNPGILLARGYTVPIRTRFIIATPILDSTSNVPFPTYNMSNVGINKNLISSDPIQRIPSNRHDPESYSVYRHYLWQLPMNSVGQIHPRHKPIVQGASGTSVFTGQPIYVHPSNKEFLGQISEPTNVPNYKGLTLIPDFAQEKIWSTTEDSTCFLGAYKTVVSQDNLNIMTMFNDYYNEFSQILSILNYEEIFREYFFRLEKAPGNLAGTTNTPLSDITRLMEAKTINITDAPQYNTLISDALGNTVNPFQMSNYTFSVDRNKERLMTTLYDSCVEKKGNSVSIYTKGLKSFSEYNGAVDFAHEVNVPEYFNDGHRQCLILTGELGTSKRSIKQLHKGRVALVYQIIDGYITIPYEIYSSRKINQTQLTSSSPTGVKLKRNIVEVSNMGNLSRSPLECE